MKTLQDRPLPVMMCVWHSGKSMGSDSRLWTPLDVSLSLGFLLLKMGLTISLGRTEVRSIWQDVYSRLAPVA